MKTVVINLPDRKDRMQRFNANRVNIRTIKVFKTIKLETNKSNLNDQSINELSIFIKG